MDMVRNALLPLSKVRCERNDKTVSMLSAVSTWTMFCRVNSYGASKLLQAYASSRTYYYGRTESRRELYDGLKRLTQRA